MFLVFFALKQLRQTSLLSLSLSISRSTSSSYLLQLSAPGSHEHHRMFSVGVGSHGAHALSPVLVQRVPLDHPQASQRLVQNQAAKIISDLLRLRTREDRGKINTTAALI